MLATEALEDAFAELHPRLHRRVWAMLGEPEAADDVLQEAFARVWLRGPAGSNPAQIEAWLTRTATNLALDELRRRRRRPASSLELAEHLAPTEPEADLTREVLQDLPSSDRFVLLMRFEAGLSASELGQLLEVTESAARKRIERARRRFQERFRAADASDLSPRIVIVSRDGDMVPYQRWLAEAGARPRLLRRIELRDLIYSDGVVFGSRRSDVHPATYGETPVAPLRGRPDDVGDRADLAAMQAVLRENVPLLGVCGGHQLLNVLSGGTLYQDLASHDRRLAHHDRRPHQVCIRPDTRLFRVVGNYAVVGSLHHQAIRRVGSRLRVVARSPDGIVEAVERTDKRFALGVQWTPESDPGGERLAEALVEHARLRAA